MKKDKGVIILAIIFLIAAFVDYYSTIRVGEVAKLLESNILASYVGLIGILIFNFLVIGVSLWAYHKTKSPLLRYSIINSLVTITIIRCFVIYVNWKIGNNPPTVQEAMEVTQEMKNAVVMKIAVNAFIPYLIGMISFIFWKQDHEISKKHDN